jgi:hypothetical protein
MSPIEEWNEDEVVPICDVCFQADENNGGVKVSLQLGDPIRMYRFRLSKTCALPLFLQLERAMGRGPAEARADASGAGCSPVG